MEARTVALDGDARRAYTAAADGDEVAFGRLVAAYDSDMYRICVAIARDQVLAADAVQAAWVIAWRRLRDVRDPDRLRSWLVTIAANETKTLLRRRKQRTDVEVAVDAAPPPFGGDDPASGVAALDLQAALDRLDPDDRALLALRYVAGFTSTELAAAIGLSPPGTRARLQRLLARLRTELS